MTKLLEMKAELKKCCDEHNDDPWTYCQEETYAEIDAMKDGEACLEFAKCGMSCCMETLKDYEADNFSSDYMGNFKEVSDNLNAWGMFVCKWQPIVDAGMPVKRNHGLESTLGCYWMDFREYDLYLKARNNLCKSNTRCFFVDPLNKTIYYVSKKGLLYRFCQLDGIGGAGSFLFAVFAEHISDDLSENYLGEMVYPPTAGAECLMDGYLTWDENGSEIADAIEEWEKKNR